MPGAPDSPRKKIHITTERKPALANRLRELAQGTARVEGVVSTKEILGNFLDLDPTARFQGSIGFGHQEGLVVNYAYHVPDIDEVVRVKIDDRRPRDGPRRRRRTVH